MTFAEAKAFRLPFGMHKGKTIDEAASTARGLTYCDWLRGSMENGPSTDPLYIALCTYLDDPVIAKDLENLV